LRVAGQLFAKAKRCNAASRPFAIEIRQG